MKAFKLLNSVVAAVLSLNVCMFASGTEAVHAATGNVIFGVMSDTHVAASKTTEQQRLAKAFQFFKNNNADADIVVGDLTDSGTASEYSAWKSVKDSSIGGVKLIAAMGNHEGNTPAGFKSATGDIPTANYIVNGYHFITLSPGSGIFNSSTGKGTIQGGSSYTYLVSWLKKQLNAAVAEDPTKPIFIFFHHPIKNTFYVSNEWYGTGLESVFSTYPQVVTFSGHIHSPNNHPQSIWQDGGFTAMNTVSLSYFEMEKGMVYGTVPPDASQCAQCLLVEVNGSVVKVRNYDLVSNQYIPQTWEFDVSQPQSFPYTHARDAAAGAPVFPHGAAVRVSDITASTATVDFDQAQVQPNTIGDIVHSYRYDFVNTSTGTTDVSFKTWSEFYILPTPSTITQKASGLKPATGYEVRIYAIDAYGKTSSSYIGAQFKTN